MRRQIAYALGMFLATAAPLHAVNLTGEWFICHDCRVDGVCDPLGPPQPGTDMWDVTQTGSNLSIDSDVFSSQTFTGTIDSAIGAFAVSCCSNIVSFEGIGSFATIDGTYDATLQYGHIWGARLCEPLSPACDDGDSCTIDTCVPTLVGSCTELPPVNACMNTQSGLCATTTSSSTSTTTTTTLLPVGHHPVAGTKLVIKKAASGKETLIFVTKDPTVYVPPFGGPDDPTTIQTQIDVYSPPETSSSFEITVPPGMGKPGWQTSPLPVPSGKSR